MVAMLMISLSILTQAQSNIHLEGTYTSEDLLKIIENLSLDTRELYCEYEGFLAYQHQKERTDLGLDNGMTQKFSGIFVFQAPSTYNNTVFQSFESTKITPQPRTIKECVFTDCKTTEILSSPSNTNARAVARPSSAVDFEKVGFYGRIFLNHNFKESLRYARKGLVYEGKEEVNGVECDKIALVFGSPPYSISDPNVTVQRFWLDMNRRGIVLQKTTHRGSWLHSQVKNLRVESPLGSDGSSFVVTHGEYTAYIKDKSDPYIYEEYNVLKESVKWNKGVTKAQLSVNYTPGTIISDQLKGLVYEFGQDRRPPPVSLKEAQSRLDESIKKSSKADNRNKASSWLRDNRDNRIYYAVILVLIFGLIASYYFMRSR